MLSPATEAKAERYRAIETWGDAAILGAIVEAQAAAVAAVRGAIPSLAEAATLLAATWTAGGRIAYIGAGSSGLIALLDALELPGTYGLAGHRLPVILAGGAASLTHLDALSEDDVEAARAAVADTGIGPGDAVIAVSASGSTPYTVAAVKAARERGAAVVSIACNASAPLLDLADIPIAIPTGAELVSGSTRMNAGTAQKCALNMLSTLTAMKLHHVHDGMMVNVRAENAKLKDRAARIVARAAHVDEAAARAALDASTGEVKPAILIAAGADPAHADVILADTAGDLGAALARLSAIPRGSEPV